MGDVLLLHHPTQPLLDHVSTCRRKPSRKRREGRGNQKEGKEENHPGSLEVEDVGSMLGESIALESYQMMSVRGLYRGRGGEDKAAATWLDLSVS